MTELVFISHNEGQTEQLGREIGALLEESFTVGLIGTLGSGKTRLVKAIAEGLEIDGKTVVSPTFTICIPHHGRLDLLHLDAYRIQSPEEVDELGLDEEVEDGAILLVEWSDKIKASLPSLELEIKAQPTGETVRTFTFRAYSERAESLVQSLRTWSQSGR